MAVRFSTGRLLMTTAWTAVWAAALAASMNYGAGLVRAPQLVRFFFALASCAALGTIIGRPRTGIALGLVAGLAFGSYRVVWD
jgi:hypothetical protein